MEERAIDEIKNEQLVADLCSELKEGYIQTSMKFDLKDILILC